MTVPKVGNPLRSKLPSGIAAKGLITKSGNLLLNKLSAKLTQCQQHTLCLRQVRLDETTSHLTTLSKNNSVSWLL